jgi:hypothetical protein
MSVFLTLTAVEDSAVTDNNSFHAPAAPDTAIFSGGHEAIIVARGVQAMNFNFCASFPSSSHPTFKETTAV